MRSARGCRFHRDHTLTRLRCCAPSRPDSLARHDGSLPGLLDGLQLIRLRRPRVRAITAGFGLERLATAFMKILASGMLSGFFCLFGLFGLSRLIGLFGLYCLFG